MYEKPLDPFFSSLDSYYYSDGKKDLIEKGHFSIWPGVELCTVALEIVNGKGLVDRIDSILFCPGSGFLETSKETSVFVNENECSVSFTQGKVQANVKINTPQEDVRKEITMNEENKMFTKGNSTTLPHKEEYNFVQPKNQGVLFLPHESGSCVGAFSLDLKKINSLNPFFKEEKLIVTRLAEVVMQNIAGHLEQFNTYVPLVDTLLFDLHSRNAEIYIPAEALIHVFYNTKIEIDTKNEKRRKADLYVYIEVMDKNKKDSMIYDMHVKVNLLKREFFDKWRGGKNKSK